MEIEGRGAKILNDDELVSWVISVRTSASLSILAALYKLRLGGPCRLQPRITANARYCEGDS